MNNSKNMKFILAAFYIFLFSFFLCNSLAHFDPDFGWHLKSGEFIFQEHKVPWEENYNYSLEGRTWVDHEWLPNVLSYIVYENFGYIVLNIIFAIIATVFFALLNSFLLKKYFKNELHFFLILLIEIFGLLAVRYHFGVRMQEISAVLFLIEVGILDRFDDLSRRKLLWVFPILFLIWANLHGGFMLGLVVLWLFFAVNLCEPALKKIFIKFPFEFGQKREGENRRILMYATASTLVTLATPYHVKYFIFMYEYTNTFYLTHISEWLPLWQYPISYLHVFYCLVLVASMIVYFLDSKEKKVSFWNFIIAAALLVSTFKARRNFPLFFAASLPFLTAIFSPVKEQKKKDENNFFLGKFILPFLSVCIVAASIYILAGADYSNDPFTYEKNCQFYPCEALKVIKNLPNQDTIRILNDYNWGGFLIWNWPGHKIFIDGRLASLKVNGHSFLEEYYDFNDPKKTEEKLNSYGVNLVLLEKYQEPRYKWFEKLFFGLKDEKKEENDLRTFLEKHEEWGLIFENKNSMVFLKQ
jgi:hypothetical protein